MIVRLVPSASGLPGHATFAWADAEGAFALAGGSGLAVAAGVSASVAKDGTAGVEGTFCSWVACGAVVGKGAVALVAKGGGGVSDGPAVSGKAGKVPAISRPKPSPTQRLRTVLSPPGRSASPADSALRSQPDINPTLTSKDRWTAFRPIKGDICAVPPRSVPFRSHSRGLRSLSVTVSNPAVELRMGCGAPRR